MDESILGQMDRLLEEWKDAFTCQSDWVEDEKTKLYFRRAIRLFDSGVRTPTLDIANIHVHPSGCGHFSNVLLPGFRRLARKYGLLIYVECVISARFENYLTRNGFRLYGESYLGNLIEVLEHGKEENQSKEANPANSESLQKSW